MDGLKRREFLFLKRYRSRPIVCGGRDKLDWRSVRIVKATLILTASGPMALFTSCAALDALAQLSKLETTKFIANEMLL
jgi:hypothetical protein